MTALDLDPVSTVILREFARYLSRVELSDEEVANRVGAATEAARQAVYGAIAALVDAGYLERVPHVSRRRRPRVRLTLEQPGALSRPGEAARERLRDLGVL